MVRNAEDKQIIVYTDRNGIEPFSEWIESLRDVIGRKRIFTRIDRLAYGNYGDCEPVGDGVSELRMFFGPGYRVYFGEYKGKVILLLNGGDKSSQRKDINRAKEYWKIYLENNA